MESKKIEWFAILEPCSKEEIYVNWITGDCVWSLPPGTPVKKSDDNLWWEIFDSENSHFYYYNSKSQKTVWQKPPNCDVLSLSKLQALKQNIYVKGTSSGSQKESTATQTTLKISAKNIQNNSKLQKCASTQTTQATPSFGNQKIKHGYSSLSEHTLSAYSFDSGCSADSSMASQSHSSLDSTSYVSYNRKPESCSVGSVDSSYFQDQCASQENTHWQECQQWENFNSCAEYNSVNPRKNSHQKPTLSQFPPPWKHSFDYWQPPPKAPSKQRSLDLAPQKYMSQVFHPKDKSFNSFNPNDQKRRSTPQHHRRQHSKNSFGLDCIKHASSCIVENNSTYTPEAVVTPLTNRRKLFGKKSDSNNLRNSQSSGSSPQNPLLPVENLQGFKCGRSNTVSGNRYVASKSASGSQGHQSLDLPFHTYGNFQGENGYDFQDRYCSDFSQRQSRNARCKSKISPDFKPTSYNTQEKKLSRHRYYSSCRQICNKSEQRHLACTSPDFRMPCCYQAENYLSPLQQYLLEQARLSGKSGDMDDKDSFSQSDEDDSDGQRNDDDDHFADDEGMSHHDSSSQEYLDNYRFFEDEYEASFYDPALCAAHRHEQLELQSNSHPHPILPPYYYEDSNGTFNNEFTCSTEDEVETCKSSRGDIEKYAEDNLNRHTKGIFRKKFTIQDMLSWSKDPIRKPMITTTDKSLKRDACDIFKLIQTYMLDHKTKSGQTYECIVLDIATRGWTKPALRDELYIQICRQTTDNPKRESLVLGWELMAVCLSFFPPSVKFQPYLEGYIKKHQSSSLDPPDLKISQYALVCGKRLEQISHKGAARSSRKPTVEEIEQSRVQIFRPSQFGNSLEEVMALQRKRYPSYSLPWIQTSLSEAVLRLNGAQTEGIFRVPGDIDEINAMKMKIEQWEVIECSDAHVPASLLKQWYRELFEPLIPADYYEECIAYCNDIEASIRIVNNLPELNKLVFSYLIRFLQVFAAEENCCMTKMDAKNLAMVMAPNCLRCTSEDPSVMLENTRKEMAFLQTLIQNLDTTDMEGLI